MVEHSANTGTTLMEEWGTETGKWCIEVKQWAR